MKKFAITLEPTPLLNHPDFSFSFGGKVEGTLPLDEQGILRAVETIALSNTPLTILEKTPYPYVVRAYTSSYPYQEIYVDTRFLYFTQQEPNIRNRSLPSIHFILNQLKSLCGIHYIWGGNWPLGIPSLLKYYPPQIDLSTCDPLIKDIWQLKGVDCSGLLYYATNGYTPRNTSSLLNYGEAIEISKRNTHAILSLLKPLDLIIWKGHVVIVFDDQFSIESLFGKGVIMTPLFERIQQLVDTPSIRDLFIIRRWFTCETHESN